MVVPEKEQKDDSKQWAGVAWCVIIDPRKKHKGENRLFESRLMCRLQCNGSAWDGT
jgi:hypothetical protein